MSSLWQTKTEHLACSWSEVAERIQYHPDWMQETPEIPSGHLLPIPDFAAKSPFGGATWWLPHLAYRNPQ